MKDRHRSERLLRAIGATPTGGRLAALAPAGLKAAIRRLLGSRAGIVAETVLARRTRNAQAKRAPSITRERLEHDLARVGLPRGVVLFVHSSLSRLGYVEGGAVTVVEVLEDIVIDRLGGTLAMPAFTIEGGMAATLRRGAEFDLRASPSGMGAITEAFRIRPGIERSLHPTHSVIAKGPLAHWLTERHHEDVRSFGPLSPLGRLLQVADGWLMGLGTDLSTVTFYHVLEDLQPNYPRQIYTLDSPLSAVCRDWDGTARTVAVLAHDPQCAAGRIDRPEGVWIKRHLTVQFERHGLRWHEVGAGKSWLVPARAMYEVLERQLALGITIYTGEAEARRLNRDADVES